MDETKPSEPDLKSILPEALGEREKDRPTPADEPNSLLANDDLIEMMRRTVEQLDNSDVSRGDLKILSRSLRELRYAFKVFAPYQRRRKVTIFGSARTKPDHPAYVQAESFAKRMAQHGWMVITGAGGGIMEAVVCYPGGFGTLDETFEVLTLLQTGKQTLVPMVLVDQPGGTYWKNVEEFFRKQLLGDKWISEEDVHLYKVTDNNDEAIREVLQFYRVYHSMRYVDDALIMRLTSRLTPEKLDKLNVDFADILVSGSIEQVGMLADEAGETELAELPRIKLHFNRRNLGRLRQLIDAINLP
ncbi:MAG: LOG family protein [Planctomycetaceae bacterium]|nr:LOG family protein [Planctomycetaceae bacterium]